MKRLIVCSDGTMNKEDQTTRGREKNNRFEPAFLEAEGQNYKIPGCTYWEPKKKRDEEIECLRNGKYKKIRERKRTPSHVVKLVRTIPPLATTKKGEKIPQYVFYDQGIGTEGGLLTNLYNSLIGKGYKANVLDCYNFLCNNYEEDDEIYLFGFSRGAFTVRSLSGLINTCGLMTKRDIHYAPEAYNVYKANPEENPDVAKLRDAICDGTYGNMNDPTIVPDIHFIGVWDTVAAIGLPGVLGILGKEARFNNYDLVSNVRYGYQALALDENRRAYKPILWNGVEKNGKAIEIEQRWFAGVHTGVGGGFYRDMLSFIPLHWMIAKAQAAGLAFTVDDLEPYYFCCKHYAGTMYKNHWFLFLPTFWDYWDWARFPRWLRKRWDNKVFKWLENLLSKIQNKRKPGLGYNETIDYSIQQRNMLMGGKYDYALSAGLEIKNDIPGADCG